LAGQHEQSRSLFLLLFAGFTALILVVGLLVLLMDRDK